MDENRERLAQSMEQRARQLRLRWVAVARRAEMSVSNLVRIRNGDIALTDFAIDAVERALEWEPGSVAAVLAGGEPTPNSSAQPSPTTPPPGWGIDAKEWARYDPVDREMILNAIRIAKQRARAQPARSITRSRDGARGAYE